MKIVAASDTVNLKRPTFWFSEYSVWAGPCGMTQQKQKPM